MTNDHDLRVLIGTTESGRYIAASTVSPFFCFEAESEQAVIEKVRAALAFVKEAHATAARPVSGSKTKSVTTLRPSKVFGAADLVVA